MPSDARFMDRAIGLAGNGQGRTAPNPCVGAVLVRGGRIVAQGWHTAYGMPHAEIECLRDAQAKGIDPSSCTIYVTLEPCNHHGKTPPCTRAILAAGIKRVVVGAMDPNPVAQGGAEFLREQGIEVRTGVRAQRCRDLIADFTRWQTDDRPFTFAKLATTLDGRIATRTGHSVWITGERARKEVHRLRSWCQAVIVGGGTFRADNPSLTCRLQDFTGNQPLAVVVTRTLPDANAPFTLLRQRPEQTIFWTSQTEAACSRAAALASIGVTVWGLSSRAGMLDLADGLRRLRNEKGCLYAMVEGGGHLAASLYTQSCMDELRLFQAMKIVGDNQAHPCFTGRDVQRMDESWNLRLLEHRFGPDQYLRLRPKE